MSINGIAQNQTNPRKQWLKKLFLFKDGKAPSAPPKAEGVAEGHLTFCHLSFRLLLKKNLVFFLMPLQPVTLSNIFRVKETVCVPRKEK